MRRIVENCNLEVQDYQFFDKYRNLDYTGPQQYYKIKRQPYLIFLATLNLQVS